MTEPTHNASLPSIQADKQARISAARELLVNFVQWFQEFIDEGDPPTRDDVERYLEEVDRA